jgi:hypothetical protein
MAIARTPGFVAPTRRGLLGGAAATTGVAPAACGGAPPAQILSRSAAPVSLVFLHENATKNEADYTADITKLFRGELPLSVLKDVERRLNLDVDTGPGGNPFKGVRWPFLPK